MPNLAEVQEGAHQILLVKRRLLAVPLYSVQEQAVAAAPVAVVLVQMVVNGAVRLLLLHIPLAAEGQLVALLMLEQPVVMDAEMAAAGQLVNNLVLEARAESLEAEAVVGAETLILGQALPMAAMAVMEPFESFHGR
jgi:hypothetical protein